MTNKEDKIVVVGAGLMGTGIAHAFASSGFATLLVDTHAESLTRAKGNIENILSTGVKLGKITDEVAQSSLANLITCGDLSEAALGANGGERRGTDASRECVKCRAVPASPAATALPQII